MHELIRRTSNKVTKHKHYSKKGSGITALLDLDVVCYSVGFAAQTNQHQVRVHGKQGVATFETKKEMNVWLAEHELGEDDYELTTIITPDPVENALHSVKVMINAVLEAVGAETYKGYLTGKGNFREKVAVTQKYKGNRDGFVRPIHFETIKEYLINVWKAEVVEGIEADDAMAMEQMKGSYNKGFKLYPDTVICSIDKDLLMVRGWHYNWNKDEKPHYVSNTKGLKWFFKQMLIGDDTDNILGCAVKKDLVYKSGKKKGQEYRKRVGVGPKEADKLLAGKSLQEQLCEVGLQYAIHTSNPEARMQEDGSLLWMMRAKDDHFDLHRMING